MLPFFLRFPSASFYYLTIEFDRKNLARCGEERKKRLSLDDSIDKWQMGLLGAIKKPTSNSFSFIFAVRVGGQPQQKKSVMTSDDSNDGF